MKPLSVLIIDDDRDFGQSLANFLRLEGHEVESAFDGEAAESLNAPRAMNVTGCLVKPFDPAELAQALEEMSEGRD